MKQGLFLIFAFCAISNAYAQMDCASIPSCAELGYTQASCPEGSASLKCPFDETKFYCIGGKKLADAPAPVITPEDWTAECADTIAHCTTLDSDCRCTACESGYLVANGNCVSECDKSVATCAAENKIFNAAACTCEACPTNYLPVDGVCKKMCTVVANCTDYNDDCACTACENGFTLDNGVCVSECFKKCKPLAGFYNGKPATDWLLKGFGKPNMVSYSFITSGAQAGYMKPYRGKNLNKGDSVKSAEAFTALFYVGDKNGDFGQGKWYIPSAGEWLDILGVNLSELVKIYGKSGASWKDYIDSSPIDDAMGVLINAGVYARFVYYSYSLTSSFRSDDRYPMVIYISESNAKFSRMAYSTQGGNSDYNGSVRLINLVKNISQEAQEPQIGDVLYTDKSYGSARNYDKTRTPAGIIFAVSNDKKDVKIISLGVVRYSAEACHSVDETVYVSHENSACTEAEFKKMSPPFRNTSFYGEEDLPVFAHGSGGSNSPTRDVKQWATYFTLSDAFRSDTLSALQEAAASGCSCEFEVPLCPEGYIFNQAGDCIKGACVLPDHCSKASGDDFDCVCTTCDRNYHLVDGECLPNNDECLSYGSLGTCQKCEINSIVHCEEYDVTRYGERNYCSCETCESGFEHGYNDLKGIWECVRAKECVDGEYNSDGDWECLSYSDKCSEYGISNCDELAEDHCSCKKCRSGYVLTESGDCQCPVIENCSAYNSDCSCRYCSGMYVKKDGKCMYHCKSSYDTSFCEVIEDNYVDRGSLCTCSVCEEGTILMEDGKCLRLWRGGVNSKCSSWTSLDNGNKQCSACADRYSLNENKYCLRDE